MTQVKSGPGPGPFFTLSLLRLRILHDRHEGSGDSSVVRAPDSWSKLGPGFEFSQERREDFLLRGQLFLLTRISVSVLPPCYCSSTQTILVIRSAKSAGGRLQVNTLHGMKWHCKLVHLGCMVYTDWICSETAEVSRGTSHVTATEIALSVYHFGGY